MTGLVRGLQEIPGKLRSLAEIPPAGGCAVLIVAPETLRQMANAMDRALASPGAETSLSDCPLPSRLADAQSGKPRRDPHPLRAIPLPVLLILSAALLAVAEQMFRP